ncbi:MAG: hypothetical protein H6Q72_2037 [Firmicutes bacterium]|nr:hypothetical protein [Bacillota bacterium]
MIAAKRDTFVMRRAVQTALACQDRLWYRSILKNDLVGCKLSVVEELAVVDGAIQTAESLAQHIIQQYGMLSPQKLAGLMGLKIVECIGDLVEPYLRLGLYEPGIRTISVNESAILLIRHFISANGLQRETPVDEILRIVLFHEIFHALEEDTPGIYTRSKMLKRKALGIFPYRRGLSSVSEVGAVHFSKCMTGIGYSPCIYERYLLLALEQLSIDFLSPTV